MKNLLTFLLLLLTLSVTSQTDTEQVMVNKINELRSNPKSFIGNVEGYIKTQEMLLEMLNSGKMKIKSTSGSLNSSNGMSNSKTTNGKSIILERINSAKELIKVLDTLSPLDTLTFNSDMYEVTEAHVKYLKDNNMVGHYGANGELARDRFKPLKLNVFENVSNFNNVDGALLNLLVDAGISNKGHRKALLNNKVKFISVVVSDKICVQNFAF